MMKKMTTLISSHFSGWVCQHRNRTGGRPSAIIGYEWVKFVQDFFGLGEPVLSFLGKDKPVFGEYFENTT